MTSIRSKYGLYPIFIEYPLFTKTIVYVYITYPKIHVILEILEQINK